MYKFIFLTLILVVIASCNDKFLIGDNRATIKGKVLYGYTKNDTTIVENLPNATVVIVGTSYSTLTDTLGSYNISNIKFFSANRDSSNFGSNKEVIYVEASKSGLDTIQVKVTIIEGKTTEVQDIILKKD